MSQPIPPCQKKKAPHPAVVNSYRSSNSTFFMGNYHPKSHHLSNCIYYFPLTHACSSTVLPWGLCSCCFLAWNVVLPTLMVLLSSPPWSLPWPSDLNWPLSVFFPQNTQYPLATIYSWVYRLSPRMSAQCYWYHAGPCGAPGLKTFLWPPFLWLQETTFTQTACFP